VVTFGEALVLFLAEPGVPLSAAVSLSFRRSVTGAELNLAVGLSRLGHRTGWFGRVGNDAHGHLIRRPEELASRVTSLLVRLRDAA
jgi:2-dehydro-3-deoxygluconokinase